MYAEQLERIQRVLGVAFRQFKPIAEQSELVDAVKSIVSGNDRLSPLQQAEIYREQFWFRHRDSLYEDYPGLLHILGEQAFEQFLRAYLLACPPDSWTLRDLGNRIAGFAVEYTEFDPGKAALARDMAAFELAFIDIWDGAETQAIELGRVESIPPEAWVTAKLELHPLLTLLALSHPVHDLRTAVRACEDDTSSIPWDIPNTPTFVALWRGEDERVHYRSMSASEDALVRSLRSGEPLGVACDRAAERAEDPSQIPGKLQAWFRGWATRGWIVDIVAQAPTTDP